MSSVAHTIPGRWQDLTGTQVSVGGNTPFLLAGSDTAWIVMSGRVEVFCVDVADGQPTGRRYHYLAADPGNALFGIDLERHGEGLGLLAVGVVGTRLLKVPMDQLRDWPGRHELVDRWITGLSHGVSRMIVPQPRADLTLEPGASGVLETGGRVRSLRGVVWVRHAEGSSVFNGMEDLPDRRPGALFPLTPESFLQAIAPTTLTAIDTSAALSGDEGWLGLESFYSVLFRCEFFNTRLAAADELNRLRDRARLDRRNQALALASLVSVIDRRSVEFDDGPGDDLLLGACKVVGRRLGFTVERPARSREGEGVADPLVEIARASRVRIRKVTLKDEWWTRETGPLLAYFEDGKRPVAILPRRPGRFELHDPETRTVIPVSRAVADALAGQAFTFYRPFPDKKMTPLDLVRFGMRGNSRDLIRPLLVGLAAGILALVPPYCMGLLVGTVIPDGDRSQLVQLALLLTAIALASASFGLVRRLSILRLETKMSAAVQPALWDHLLSLPAAFFRRFAAGDLAERVGCIDSMRRILSGAATSSITTSVFSLLLLAQVFYYNWPLALAGTGLVALALVCTGVLAWLRLRQQRPTIEVEGRISGLVLQLLTGIAKLRVAGAETRAFAVWAHQFSRQKQLAMRSGTIETWAKTFNVVFPPVSLMLTFFVVVSLSAEALKAGGRPVSAGDFIVFNTAFGMFLMQMLELGKTAMSTLTVVPLFERARPVLTSDREVDQSKVDPGELAGRIDVDRVSFRYQKDGPLILNDLSIQVAPGEYVALVGPSGSGKSTLARLLLGLEVPESGSIYYDGRDLSLLDVQKLRHKMGVVMQAGKVRAGSLLENIIGSAPLTVDDAWEAARQAGLEDDIRKMPMGMQTVLQQGGTTLSGGQRQRLMIARAIVNTPRILVFDEATSALDNRTQAIVTRGLARLQATRIAIAHRLSTIVGADRIYVMQDGRVVQKGTYEELAAQDGLFADLIKRQLA